MKFSVILSEINRQLQEITGIAGVSPNKEDITQNIYFAVKDNVLILKSTDYSIELIARIPLQYVDSEGEIIVNGAKLREVLKNIDSNSSVSFDYDDINQKMQISADNTKFEIRVREACDFPVFESDEISHRVTVKQGILRSLLDKSLFCVASDDFRDYLRGVRLELDGSTLSVFTSDGHRMAILETQIDGVVSEPYGVLLTRRCALELTKILEHDSQTDIELSFSKNSLKTNCNGYLLSSKLIVCGYPNVRSVIPKEIVTQIRLPRQAFCSFIKRVSVLSSRRISGITFNFSNNNVEMRCENSEHEIATANMGLEYTGAPIEISLNSNYIIEILNIIDSDDVLFNFSNPINGVMIVPDENAFKIGIKYSYIVSKVVV